MSIFGFRVSACSVGTSSPCRICSSTLVSPAMPAADSRWPMLDLTDPMAQKPVSPVKPRQARVSAAISIGSPSAVPVPCAST
ncbi:hypothetical protein ABAZ39_27240 (plasmid) [Azospirillum argentinense]|uniref:Uncharacterized protein n=1 Tax=Azospirillum argentinense TaxID=2970906 RepID=A0A060DNV4_9PROT|nr:hypothetical protein ABAZ39_27240 [Azospirillum argentinense]EZQ03734.1 hypothetical protein ABAZ39_28920 [Azospirillum argentinense]